MAHRWIVPTLLAVAFGLLLAGPPGLAQESDPASTCEDLCYEAEDRCFDSCEDADDPSACEDRCIEASRACIGACD